MSRNRTALIIGGLVVVVIVAAVLAVLLTGGDDDAASDSGEVTLEEGDLEVYPVTITGDPLPQLEDPTADPAVGTFAPEADGRDYWGGTTSIGG